MEIYTQDKTKVNTISITIGFANDQETGPDQRTDKGEEESKPTPTPYPTSNPLPA